MKSLKMSTVLAFVLLSSAATFYGAQAETSAETAINTSDRQDPLENQGFFSRISNNAQQIVTRPVNYVFGEKDSYAKKIFYVLAGGVIVAITGYGLYRYNYACLMNQAQEDEKQAEVQEVEKLIQRADTAKLAQIEAQTERDLKLYKSIVASRMNAQADYRATELKLQQLEHDWNTGGKYRYGNYMDTYGRNPYHDAEVAYHKERAELSSKITDLGKKWSNFTVQEAQFERDHTHLSREQLKEVEQWALGVFHRWGRVVIA